MQKQYLESLKKVETPTISYTHWELAWHMTWCNNNGIIIYPSVIDNYSLRLIVETNGVGKMGQKVYKQGLAKMTKNDEQYEKVIRKLYTHYFLKLGGSPKEGTEVELESKIMITNIRTGGTIKQDESIKKSLLAGKTVVYVTKRDIGLVISRLNCMFGIKVVHEKIKDELYRLKLEAV